jgi:hypothetical protein
MVSCCFLFSYCFGRGFLGEVNGFCHCGSMEKNLFSRFEAGCFWLKQFVGDCTCH